MYFSRYSPGGGFPHASAGYNSIYGLVESGWEKTQEGYMFKISIPCNTTATIILPDGKEHRVNSGSYVFAC